MLAFGGLGVVGGLGGLALGLVAFAVPARRRLRVLVAVGVALVVAVGWHSQVAARGWETAVTQALGLALLALAAAVHAREDGPLDESPGEV